MTAVSDPGQLELLKVLGDDTRHAIYLHLADNSAPRTTAEIAEFLGLHPNTVRPHLERMRDVGLLDVSVDARGEVGRPQHRYALASDAPSLHVRPPAVDELATMVLSMATRLGASSGDAHDVGYDRGIERATTYEQAPSSLEALVAELDRMGFEPSVSEGDDEAAVVAFERCPFQAQVDEHPELICSLHHGIVTGLLDGMGDAEVARFCDRSHRTPCRVKVHSR